MTTLCSNCRRKPVLCRNRCSTCYRYRHKYGRERHRYLYDPDAICRDCDRNIRHAGVPLNGYCRSCGSRKHRRAGRNGNGQQEPRSETCDCGEPAVIGVRVRCKGTFWMDLCAECWREERVMRRRVG